MKKLYVILNSTAHCLKEQNLTHCNLNAGNAETMTNAELHTLELGKRRKKSSTAIRTCIKCNDGRVSDIVKRGMK